MSKCQPIVSGELHYPRIPVEYWQGRLAMACAMGLNAVSTYVFWNCHERREGVFDFSGGNDVARFVRLAQAEGLAVILRPGPYVCAEWDFGGLPAWLLKDGEIPVRSTDARFMRPVHRWLARLGQELAPLQASRGGPIIAVQLENEYGAFGSDTEYLRALRAALEDAGFGVSPFYTIDQPGDLSRGSVDEIPVAVTFAPGDPGVQFAQVQALRPDGPLLCGEYWAGWFDHWGEPHAELDDVQQANDLEWMLSRKISVNIYMFHGGTNFGFWNGANAFEPFPYQPAVTSYDYQAALDEAGRPTPKYRRFREIIAEHTARLLPVPAEPSVDIVDAFTLSECALFSDTLPQPIESDTVLHMEALGQDFGFILYRTRLPAGRGELFVDGVRDYAVVSVDGNVVAHMDRRLGDSRIGLAVERSGAVLDILVENCGRINYGPKFPAECKGIVGDVFFNGDALRGWSMYSLPLDRVEVTSWRTSTALAPAFYRGTFHVDEPLDLFLDTSDLRKGALWINGRNAGRFWDIGPQKKLYVPGVWLRRGANEAIALDLFERDRLPRLYSA